MSQEISESMMNDPQTIDWSQISLPKTFPDLVDSPIKVVGLIRRVFGKRQRVQIPEDMPGKEILPKYLLQEFHNIPNGNYSERFSSGYIKGFDISMLNQNTPARAEMASFYKNMHSVLDVGCAGGKMGAALLDVGVKEVWGLDPSPYLLRHAARAYPEIKFLQGIAESTGFPELRFDGITAYFVFHEIPPKAADEALKEFYRILKPGGLVSFAEPSVIQMRESKMSLLKQWGIKGVYFGIVAHWMHEPFVKAWHKKDVPAWLEQHGFELVDDVDVVPIRRVVARKV